MYLLCARRLEPKETIRCGKLISSFTGLLFYIFVLGTRLGDKDGYARNFHDYVCSLFGYSILKYSINKFTTCR